jgi:hypothetical protein
MAANGPRAGRRAGQEETEKPDRLLNPFDIGDHRNTLPAREVFHPNFEVFPNSARIDA